MKHPLLKRLWGLLVIWLVVTGTSCASAPSPIGRSLPASLWEGQRTIGTPVGPDGKLPGEGAPDAVWATAEDRQHYKPLVVALARQDLLLQHPGVVGIRAGYGELRVYTMNPIMLPSQLWGVPVTAFSPSQCPTCVGGEAVPATIPSAVPPEYHQYFR